MCGLAGIRHGPSLAHGGRYAEPIRTPDGGGLPPHHDEFARAALRCYGRARDTPLRLLSLSENATYLVDDEDPMVLRVHRPGYNDVAAIRSELRWMTALRHETSVVTPHLIITTEGDEVQPITVDGLTLHVDAVSFIPGCTAEERPDAVGFDELGRITAALHDHVLRWRPPRGFTRFRWDLAAMLGPQARWGDWRHAPGLSIADTEVITRASAEITRRLGEFGCSPDRFGLIHADLRMANLMVDPDDPNAPLTVIDFDDSGWSWFLADAGAVVSFIEDTPQAETMLADWVTGYRSARELPAAQSGLIPTFVMLRRIQLAAWIGSHPDADAAIPLTPTFAAGTAKLADQYLTDPAWLRDALR